jgi:hypothetical protein
MPVICRWPGCGRTGDNDADGSLISPPYGPGAGYWWCLDHLEDDCLPEVHIGKSGVCGYCRNSCVWWLVEPDPRGRWQCVHPNCRRAFVTERNPILDEALPTDVPLVGAYARRHAV